MGQTLANEGWELSDKWTSLQRAGLRHVPSAWQGVLGSKSPAAPLEAESMHLCMESPSLPVSALFPGTCR